MVRQIVDTTRPISAPVLIKQQIKLKGLLYRHPRQLELDL